MRVPWRSYPGGPQRIPPKHVAAPQEASQPENQADPPLLTPEELAALLGDEPASGTD